jgi:tetratricopeptide (TPR) repeat protein
VSHLSDDVTGRLLTGGLEPAVLRGAVRHLLAGCPDCGRKLAPSLQPADDDSTEESVTAGDAYDAMLDRVIAGALEREVPRWKRERDQLARVLAAARDCQWGITALSGKVEKDLRGWPFFEALLRSSFEARFRDPRAMLDLARAAQAAATGLDCRKYLPGLVADFQARAWGELANARRLNDDFAGADEAFARAAELLEEGTGDVLVAARLLDLKASLRSSQRRLSEALKLLDLAHETYVRTGEDHLAGRVLVKKGATLRNGGCSEEAVPLLHEGLARINPRRDPRLAAIGRQTLVDALIDCERYAEAARLFLESGVRRAFSGEPLSLARVRWIEGKIFAGLGKPQRAEAIFLQVRGGFRERGQEYDAALVGLDLAAVWLRLGRKAEVRELAAEILGTFQSLQVEPEALRAVRCLDEACGREKATPGLARQVGGFLRRLEWQPRLRFAPLD